MTFRDPKSTLKLVLLSAAILLIVGYSFAKARNLLTGPVIAVTAPLPGSTVHASLIEVTGTARNVAALTLDDRPIVIDEEGRYAESLLLSPGYSILKLEGKDRFGKTKRKLVEVVYQ
jgi:hypothetical protein